MGTFQMKSWQVLLLTAAIIAAVLSGQLLFGEPNQATMSDGPRVTVSNPQAIPGQAVLPRALQERTIADMRPGESAYVVPWAMWVDAKGRCWLHPYYTPSASPGGTVEMQIQRMSDGYHVWVPKDEQWLPSSEPGYNSPADTAYLPVVSLHR